VFYRMAMLTLGEAQYSKFNFVMLWVNLNIRPSHPNSCIFVAIHIFVVSQRTDFKFGTHGLQTRP